MSGEEPKFAVEEVTSAEAPPRARVDDAETPAEKLERKRDYLEGFLAEKPQGLAAGEPGGAIYDGVIGQGANTTYHLAGVASFVLTGYFLSGVQAESWLTGRHSCSGSDRCLYG